MEENKIFVNDLYDRVNTLLEEKVDIEAFKMQIAERLTDQEIQEILYIDEPDHATERVCQIFTKVEGELSEANIGDKTDRSEGWVESEEMEEVINKIYPTRTELCELVLTSINMLMLADTSKGILRAVEFLFSNLSKNEK